MRTLVHLSDLHFGHTDPQLIAPLTAEVHAAKPHVVVISGDLTQRARIEQFEEARRFLDGLPSPRVVVPGNHDVPLYNPFDRFVRPLTKYRRYITSELEPAFIDEEIAVLGLSTARSLAIKNGRINRDQVTRIADRLRQLDEHIVRIVVTHHPFDAPGTAGKHALVGRAEMAMRAFAELGVDLLLSGHHHLSHAENTAARYDLGGYNAIAVQAGTAASTRHRGETNSFNIIHVSDRAVTIEHLCWRAEQGRFVLGSTNRFSYAADGWHAERSYN